MSWIDYNKEIEHIDNLVERIMSTYASFTKKEMQEVVEVLLNYKILLQICKIKKRGIE